MKDESILKIRKDCTCYNVKKYLDACYLSECLVVLKIPILISPQDDHHQWNHLPSPLRLQSQIGNLHGSRRESPTLDSTVNESPVDEVW